MKTYMLEFRGIASGRIWQMQFQVANERMAKEYAKKTLVHDFYFRGIGSVLFLMEPDGRHIAAFKLNEPSVVEVLPETTGEA